MTSIEDSNQAAPEWRPRSELDRAAAQLRGIERLTRARQMAEEAAAVAGRSREMRMDAARELEVLRRQQDALVARTQEQLRVCGTHPLGIAETTVVLVHRSEWFVDKVSEALRAGGCVVLSDVANGADAVGVVAAEQPDLVLIEGRVAMLPAEQVIRQIRSLCPTTIIAAQVDYSDSVGAMLDAGASTVFTRQVPPAEVAAALLSLVQARP